MEDYQIVDMYWNRNEAAITQSDRKYGRMLTSLSASLLSSLPDAEECVNDTYLAAWGHMPTDRPTYLGAYLAKITRRISVDRYRHMHRQKRGGLNSITAELSECIPASFSLEDSITDDQLATILSAFLRKLPETERRLFICRYFHCDSIATLSQTFGMKESRVKTTLMRTRHKLAAYLTEKGVLL